MVKTRIMNFIKGMLIGIANIIPGVSGGTFALILGIYNRLIESIGSIDSRFFKGVLKGNFREEFKRIDALFLLEIVSGAVVSLAVFSWIMDYLLKSYPGYTLSFFMGLIIPMIAVPYRMIDKKRWVNLIYFLPGVLIVLTIYFYQPDAKVLNTAFSMPYLFLSGALAISAMILPGISGSFLLLVLGVYESIISNIKVFTSSFTFASFIYLVVFGAGCILGLILFVRVMKFLLFRYKDKTLYFLIGLILGSLVVMWPFKEYPQTLYRQKTEIVIITARNSLPRSMRELVGYSLFLIIGLAGSYGLSGIAKKD